MAGALRPCHPGPLVSEHMFVSVRAEMPEVILSCGMCSQPYSVQAARLVGRMIGALLDHAMLGPMGEPGRGSAKGQACRRCAMTHETAGRRGGAASTARRSSR